MFNGVGCVGMCALYVYSLQVLQIPLCCFKAPKCFERHGEINILPTVAMLKEKSYDWSDVLSSFEGE